MSADSEEQKQLKNMIARRHPLYEAMAEHWQFMGDTYAGGRGWFSENIFKYVKEGEEEFKERKKRAYRFNHTREVVDLVQKYLFKMEISRNMEDAPKSVKAFWNQASLNKSSIQDFMKQVANRSSVFGRAWIVVDSTRTDGIETKADEKSVGKRTYAYMVAPQHALDMSYDDMGELNWILIYEEGRDDEDPMNSSGEEIQRFRLWTRVDSKLFEVRKSANGKSFKIVLVDQVDHDLGVVPVINADNVISDELYTSPAMIADVAYLDRACANYLSNLDAIIQDQTFSQLVMPATGIGPEDDGYKQLVEMGTKRIFTYNAEGGGKPEFISPDVKQAQLILSVINKIINEIYHSIGLAGERTKEDNALGIDNSSGVAKAYDFERVNSLLAAKADALQMIENKLCWLVAKWNGEEKDIEAQEKGLVLYPDNFDVRGLYDEFEIAARLTLIEAPESVRREQMDILIEKLFPQLAEDVKKMIKKDLETWPPEPIVEPAGAGTDVIDSTGKKALAKKLVGKQ